MRVIYHRYIISLLRRQVESALHACPECVQVLAAHGLTPSMSRIANPYDNAKAESFMKTLKAEEVNGRQYRDYAELERSLAHLLNHHDNQHRLHSALGYQPPVHYEHSILPAPLVLAVCPPCP